MGKANTFHFPRTGALGLGRVISAAWDGWGCRAATRFEEVGGEGILFRHWVEGDVRTTKLAGDAVALCHRTCLSASEDGTTLLAWNAYGHGKWVVNFTFRRGDGADGMIERPCESARLCLPPAAASQGKDFWLAWPVWDGAGERLCAMRLAEYNWFDTDTSKVGPGLLRPSLAATGDTVYMAADEYHDGAYRVVLMRLEGEKWTRLATLGEPGERWFCPRIAAGPDGAVYLTWVVMREVSDDLGIAEHWPFAMLARCDGDTVRIIRDPDHTEDDRTTADLREGLLASRIYRGHHGLRRNPQLSVSDSGEVWLLWEGRLEEERDHLCGRLMGRRVAPDGALGPVVLLLDRGYGFAVPATFSGSELPVVFYDDSQEGDDVLCRASADVSAGRALGLDPSRWPRWRPERVPASPMPSGAVGLDGRDLQMFWADTHCHSVFSPDAEGEVDELIHFARDEAGLDAVCIVDNDYYPHKALSQAEWQVHQGLCRQFTREGEFVAFPGYEFTYHRADLDPDFNHRVVLYPRPGGRLLRRIDPESDSDRKLFNELRGSDAMCYPHHCTYQVIDPELDWNVEVVSSWRVCMEENDFTIRRLKEGARFGFIGSSDSHRACPGLGGALTGIFADELTPESLFDAYRNRRTVATQGFRLFVDFRVNGVFIGGEGSASGPPEVEAAVRANDPIESVEVVRDGAVIHRIEPNAAECELRFRDETAAPGERFYFLRVRLEGDPSFNTPPGDNLRPFRTEGRYPHNLARARGVFAWTSPIWIMAR